MKDGQTKCEKLDIVWSEDRDEIFMNRLAEDIGRLQDAGFEDKVIKKMIGTLQYVHFWIGWPVWAFPVDKLPKGSKWTDGEKFSFKPHKKGTAETYTFLAVGDDLYFKLGNCVPFLPGLHRQVKVFIRIADFRSITANEFLSGIDISPFFHDCITKFWKEHGGRQGYVEPCARPADRR